MKHLRLRVPLVLVAVVLMVCGSGAVQGQQPDQPYFPASGDSWQKKQPQEVGMDAALLAKAVEWAQGQETSNPIDFSDQVERFGRMLGPLPPERGRTNGLIVRHGYIVAEWGDTSRIDPTYSAAKSYLSTFLGLALDKGLIQDVQDPVSNYVKDGGYDSPHNAKITWHQHAQQTSEWEGTLWDKPHDFFELEEFGNARREPRQLQEPGTYYEYNDVRINRFALSLLRVFKKPLPQVLKEQIMDPIGASDTWQYHGYENSDVVINGRTMKSVTGGTRWGGGLWINTRDHARYGYLFLRKGRWGNRQILSERWIRMATTRGTLDPDYGYLWWLNTDGGAAPDAPKTAFRASGFGSNTVWIDPEHDLVVVWRWHNGRALNEFNKMIVDAIRPDATSSEAAARR
jgi:CubicO group peptidase (beta-lactamase class C family)